MNARAAALIASLGLAPHPEGGYYRQLFRSGSAVTPADGRPARCALTTIYFLLAGDDISRWHRVRSDEAWHHYEGAPIELLTANPALDQVTSRLLGPIDSGGQPVHVVPAGEWQAARSTGAYTLVGCSVGPGFEFDDFLMLRDVPEEAEWLRRHAPNFAGFI